ncbi:uncharacterized protein DNG_05552 [Cephalotrichum gorgonifer]|uniref:PH domain-containing protein n=1 Tax=Cephalotrichum gorgonifer TaxID=2041049 RepID=A0AAE8N033_9PEZI|nr:uncharacterized protein DNG_05552 [Cephalotrichum gorgonifer]
MEPPSTLPDYASSPSPTGPPPRRRRLSMDDDIRYHQIVTTVNRRPSQHPPANDPNGQGKDEPPPPFPAGEAPAVEEGSEELPGYSCSVHCEGVFTKKMEIEHTTKRSEDRRWHACYVVLHGTALNVHYVKKDWGLGKSKGGPGISPDRPPWIKKGKLDKAYSLQYADVGIALDYQKRRHVIRVRAEADQFLLSCVELSTFLEWLEALFSAIDVAAPIDERDFPRDQSIPRIQRIQWIRGEPSDLSPPPLEDVDGDGTGAALPSGSSPHVTRMGEEEVLPIEYEDEDEAENDDDGSSYLPAASTSGNGDHLTGPSREPVGRLSTTSYHNDEIDYLSGKWAPAHHWGPIHDMHYAKLCYSVLLFRSPRKSNYIVTRGKKWFVDWMTGRMVRVLPPEYGEIDLFGPWQIVHTENRFL